jgi:hydrogenase expression/formation protein HypE
VACEGRFIAFVPAPDAERALGILRAHPLGAGAGCIGQVTGPGQGAPKVVLKNAIGVLRVLEMGSGEQLPRIC